MPSTRPKPPSHYPAYWIAVLRYLAEGGVMKEVDLADGLDDKQIHTQHAKARAIRQSVQLYPGWRLDIKEMITSGRLHYRRERRGETWALVAYVENRRTPITNLLPRESN